MKPLAIDLFCGLDLKTEFCLRANPAIQELMTGGAKNPNHMRQTVLYLSTYPPAPMSGTMRQFYDATFATGLTGRRQVGKFAAESDNHTGVFKFTSPVVNLLDAGVFPVEGPTLFLECLASAFVRAVTAVAGRLNNRKMLPANSAIASVASYIGLFPSPQSARAGGTFRRAMALVGPFCAKPNTTERAE